MPRRRAAWRRTRRQSVPCSDGNSRAGAREGSLAEPVLQQHPQRDEAIAPRNLLPFFVAPAVVGNWHFVDAIVPLENLGGELGLDAEPVRLERQRPEHLAAHDL